MENNYPVDRLRWLVADIAVAVRRDEALALIFSESIGAVDPPGRPPRGCWTHRSARRRCR